MGFNCISVLVIIQTLEKIFGVFPIVGLNRPVVSTGGHGFPEGWSDGETAWGRRAAWMPGIRMTARQLPRSTAVDAGIMILNFLCPCWRGEEDQWNLLFAILLHQKIPLFQFCCKN